MLWCISDCKRSDETPHSATVGPKKLSVVSSDIDEKGICILQKKGYTHFTAEHAFLSTVHTSVARTLQSIQLTRNNCPIGLREKDKIAVMFLYLTINSRAAK